MKPTLFSLLRLGVVRGSRWRVLALFAGLAVLPPLVGLLPVWTYLSRRLDHAVGAETMARVIDVRTALGLLRGLSEEGAGRAISFGLAGALLLALVVGPWSAGAALAEGRAPEPMRIRGLLAAAGDLYGRLLRMLLVAAIPLGIAFAIGGALSSAAEEAAGKVVTEAAASRLGNWALGATALLVFLAHLTVDAGRAHLAAHPERRSAFLAWVAGAWMVIRRPVPSIVIGAAGSALALGLAFLVMAARGHLPSGPAGTATGVLLATLATASIAWGRSIRLSALSELAAFDAGERMRRKLLRRARQAARTAPTEPLFPAVTPPVAGAAEPPVESETRPLDVTAPVQAPPKSEG